ncbi:DUF4190 domain-containing protein [Krasilnikovia sp. M28-CT-15]|uniref:DUF4190 domain-containing protein n=1 Tax=Krasilnikovia sp. M28-CT-15 TaxID=3373540 RepID=UPI003875CAC1
MQPGQDPYQQQPPVPPGSYPPPPDPYPGSYPPPHYPPGGPMGGPTGPENTLGLVGMILGICSIPLQLCCQLLGVPVAIAAMVVSILGLNKVKAGVATNRGQALAGLICGAVALAISLLFLILLVARGTWDFSTFNDL